MMVIVPLPSLLFDRDPDELFAPAHGVRHIPYKFLTA